MHPSQPKRILQHAVLTLCLAICCCLPLAASAQTPSLEGISEAKLNSAKLKYQTGSEAFRERRFADAVHLFLEADTLAPSAALSFNIALAYENLSDSRAALRWFRDYLRRSPSAQNAPLVLNKCAALARILAAQGVQQLSVFSTPTGATVVIDRRNVGTTPITLELSPSKHQLHLHLEGYVDQDSEVLLAKYEPQDVSYELVPVSGAQEAVSPSARYLTPAQQPSSNRPDSEERHASRFGSLPWIPTGVGAATLGLSLGFELARRSEETKAKDALSQVDFKTHIDTMTSNKQTARILGGIGGALVLSGGVLFLFNTEPSPATRVGFGCGASGCGVLAKGNF